MKTTAVAIVLLVLGVGCGPSPVRQNCADGPDAGALPAGTVRVRAPDIQTGQVWTVTVSRAIKCEIWTQQRYIDCVNVDGMFPEVSLRFDKIPAQAGEVIDPTTRFVAFAVDTGIAIGSTTTDPNGSLRLTVVRMPTDTTPGEVTINGTACSVDDKPSTVTVVGVTAPLTYLR